MLIDTHCHLTHERYDADRTEVLLRARAAGVVEVVSVASDLDDATAVQELADRLRKGAEGRTTAEGATGEDRGSGTSGEAVPPARVWGTAGVHPHEAAGAPRDLRARLEAFLDEHPGVVAVGECGLDYHYDLSPRPVQRGVFRLQIEVAEARGLPLVVHCREAEADMAPIVRAAGEAGVRGVLHCFPGDLDLLETALEAGWFVSFTGLVTFPSWEGAEAVRRVEKDRFMLETDGPYMAPVPHRGKRNEPAWIPRIRDRVAELRGERPQEVERATTDSARRLFGL
jgi:TatD DNase family protein